jgi:exodeoxyribonuclease VII small subunit
MPPVKPPATTSTAEPRAGSRAVDAGGAPSGDGLTAGVTGPAAAPGIADVADVADLAFEAALNRLEAVVQKLEKGDLSLEQSLSAYEEGVRLASAARGRLEGLQGRLEQLLADGSTVPLPRTTTAERGPS